MVSPYVGMGNDPTNLVDHSGGGVEGPGPSFINLSTIQDEWNELFVPFGKCDYCETVGRARELATVMVTAIRTPSPSLLDYAKLAKYHLWDSWHGIGREWGRRALIRAGAIEIGAFSAITFGAVPAKPIFGGENYTDEDMEVFNGSAKAAQIIPFFLDGGGIGPKFDLKVAPSEGTPINFNPAKSLDLPAAKVDVTGPSNPSGSGGGGTNYPIPSRYYDRPWTEIKNDNAIPQKDILDDWNDFLGPNQTNIDPRDGLPDPDRIWSADGLEVSGLAGMKQKALVLHCIIITKKPGSRIGY